MKTTQAIIVTLISGFLLYSACGNENPSNPTSEPQKVDDGNVTVSNSILGKIYKGSKGEAARRYYGFYFFKKDTCIKIYKSSDGDLFSAIVPYQIEGKNITIEKNTIWQINLEMIDGNLLKEKDVRFRRVLFVTKDFENF
jgi:hypothetical protein